MVHDAPILRFYESDEGKGAVEVAGTIFKPEAYGIAFPTNSQLIESVNRSLLKLRESGKYDEIHRKWFGGE